MVAVIGFDPGGAKNFGWALVDVSSGGSASVVRTGIVDESGAAIDQALRALPQGTIPKAAAIDAPLFYSRSGGRRVDALVRKAMIRAGAENVSGTVQHPNSLRGACLVQGILLAVDLRERFPDLSITECHPKALRVLYEPSAAITAPTEHERDAAISAFSAWASLTDPVGWANLAELEPRPYFPFPGSASYWMPSSVASAT